jgi:uncharacterized alpha-E superfamily protein
MLCRVAEQIFWMGRYVERSIAVSRLVDVILHLELDVGEDDDTDLWAPLVGGQTDSAVAARQYLTFARDNPNALVVCISNARSAARGVRESISSEMWERINTLHLSVVDPRLAQDAEDDPHTFYKRVREGAQATQGLADSTLAHGEDWHFFNLGTYLERADNVARVLTLENQLLVGGPGATQGDSTVRWLAVLRSCGSAEAYARYYSLRVEPARVIEFLLLNPTFPQSIRFSLNAAWQALLGIAGEEAVAEGTNPAVRALGLLRANVEHAAVDEVLELGLPTFLGDVQRRIWEVAEHVTRIYLRDHAMQERTMPAARAAMLMAAQQQQ